MLLNWLKKINKNYPEFWKIYLGKFEDKPSRFVVLSTDTSGLDPQKDVLLSIGAVAIVDNTIVVNDAFEVAFFDNTPVIESATYDLTNGDTAIKVQEKIAIQSFVEYLGNAILVGHRIHFDVEVINEALDRMKCGRLKNEALDIEVMHKKVYDIEDTKQFSVDDLLRTYKLKRGDRHSSSDDAYSIALLFLKLKSRLGIL
jgi:DNA polymerase III subunit epsilon